MPKMILPPRHHWCGGHHDPDACPEFGPQAQTLHDMAAQAVADQDYVLAGLLARTLDDLGYQVRRAAAGQFQKNRKTSTAEAITRMLRQAPAAAGPVAGVPASGCDCLLDGGQGLAPAADQGRGHPDDCPASDRYPAWLASWEQCPDRAVYASAAEHRRDCPTHQTAVPVGGNVTPAAQDPAEGSATDCIIPAASPDAIKSVNSPADRAIRLGAWFGRP
jgi:hypothetical protein